MMLGRPHRTTLNPVWSTAYMLETCAVGTVVRNFCDHRDPEGAGAHYRKVRMGAGDCCWKPCRPDGQVWATSPHLSPMMMALPVQCVRQGEDEQ